MKKVIIFPLAIIFLLSAVAVSYSAPKAKENPAAKKLIQLTKPAVKKAELVQNTPTTKRPRFLFEAGYFAGGGGAKAGFIFPKNIVQMEPHILVGYGVGTNYGVTLVQAELANYDSPYSYGISLDLASYSAKVLGIPGLPDVTEKGNRFGIGAFIGKEIRNLNIKAGYSSTLGYTITAGKRF